MNPILTALAVQATAVVVFLAAAAVISRRIDGPEAPIVVVDRRTYRLAQTRIQQAIDVGDDFRAYAGMTAVRLWLRQEILTGPKRRRIAYARALEYWELRAEQAGHRSILHAP